MIFWTDSKAAIARAAKTAIKGVFQFTYMVTSEAPVVEIDLTNSRTVTMQKINRTVTMVTVPRTIK